MAVRTKLGEGSSKNAASNELGGCSVVSCAKGSDNHINTSILLSRSDVIIVKWSMSRKDILIARDPPVSGKPRKPAEMAANPSARDDKTFPLSHSFNKHLSSPCFLHLHAPAPV